MLGSAATAEYPHLLPDNLYGGFASRAQDLPRVDFARFGRHNLAHRPYKGLADIGVDVDLAHPQEIALRTASSGTPDDPCSTMGMFTRR